MHAIRRPRLVLRGVAIAGLVVGALVLPTRESSARTAAHSVRWKIHDAMRAAPPAVAGHATILDWPKKPGDPSPLLRTGNNGWTCFPDDPTTPRDDPMCLDKPAMDWLAAWMAGKDPKLTQPGLGYMLQGGSDASNTDPSATKPASGQRWLITPPHMMIFPIDKLDPDLHGTDPSTGRPWIMWPATAYEHLMIPIRSGRRNCPWVEGLGGLPTP